MRIAIFTGSAAGHSPVYADAATTLATYLAGHGHGIVFGGGKVGLMGVVADAALAAGGEVIGVIPQALVDREVAHHGVTQLDIVTTMHERKARMVDLADALVALPGGVGTLDEFFESWTWLLLGIHAKPVALYDVDGYWQPLRTTLEQMVGEGFLGAPHHDGLIVATEPADLLTQIAGWESPARKWV